MESGSGQSYMKVSYTFSATTVIMTMVSASQNTTADMGELYRVSNTPVTERITDTLYSFTVSTPTGYQTEEFAKVDASTINWTVRTNVVTSGPTPLHRL